MARFDTSGLDELMAEMDYYGESAGPTADKMLLAGAEAVKEEWRKEATRRNFRDSGDMIKSIGFPRSVSKAQDIQSVDIYPQGKDRDGVSNAEKAFVLHYGRKSSGKPTKGKKLPGPGIPATHWVDDADRNSAAPVQAAMEKIWDDYLKGMK